MRETLRMLEHQEFDESPALEAGLLEGVRSGHQPCNETTFERIRQKARA